CHEVQWKLNCDAYQAHREMIRTNLPKSMRDFCDTTLHDGLIKTAKRATNDSIIFEIDGNGCCWGPVGQFELRFDGVQEVEGLEDCVAGWWLYEEVYLHPPAGFDYCVLFDKSELRIVAKSVHFTVVTKGKRPIVYRVKDDA